MTNNFQNWIPVTERLPEMGKMTRCLVTIAHRDQKNRVGDSVEGRFVEYSFYDARDLEAQPKFDIENQIEYVVAWQPLPEPYSN